jgi:hypothetical protein
MFFLQKIVYIIIFFSKNECMTNFIEIIIMNDKIKYSIHLLVNKQFMIIILIIQKLKYFNYKINIIELNI